MSDAFWIDVVAVILLVLLGYAGGRLAERFGLPAVTAFLLVGIFFGPSGVNLLRADVLRQIAFLEPLALGIIVFLVGEELTPRTLRSRPPWFWVTAVLAVVLPLVLVGAGIFAVAGDFRLAWVLAVIGLSGAPATIMAVLHEARRRGPAMDTLLGTAAIDNVVTVVLYAVSVPLLLASGTRPLVAEAGLRIAQDVGAAIAVGFIVGFALAYILNQVSDRGQQLLLGALGVALVVALDEIFHSSVILACLVAGITVAVRQEGTGKRGELFDAMSTLKYGVYIIFFTLAGAALQPALAFSAGALALVYILMRSVGRVGAGFFGGLAGSLGRRGSWIIGLGMLPQAGVAVGLALDAGATFPQIGPTVNAVVLAAIVFFELVGPMAVRSAVNELGIEVAEPVADGPLCELRVVAVAVTPRTSGDDVLRALEAAHLINVGCPLQVDLINVQPARRTRGADLSTPVSSPELGAIAADIEAAGHIPHINVVSGTNVERQVAAVVRERGASTLLVPVKGGARRRLLSAPLKSRRHRLVDAVDVPATIVDVDALPPVPTSAVLPVEPDDDA